MAAYISVPRDLTKVKSKVAFNLTKRQLICFGTAALILHFFSVCTRKTVNHWKSCCRTMFRRGSCARRFDLIRQTTTMRF